MKYSVGNSSILDSGSTENLMGRENYHIQMALIMKETSNKIRGKALENMFTKMAEAGKASGKRIGSTVEEFTLTFQVSKFMVFGDKECKFQPNLTLVRSI